MADACHRCGSARVARLTAKCSDLCTTEVDGNLREGHVPGDMGVGGDDYVELAWCLACGQLQGAWPLPPCGLEGPRCAACAGRGRTLRVDPRAGYQTWTTCDACDGAGRAH